LQNLALLHRGQDVEFIKDEQAVFISRHKQEEEKVFHVHMQEFMNETAYRYKEKV
jgi:hypothetical protein